MRPLGRRTPTDWGHVEQHPFLAPRTVDTVERNIPLPYWHWGHDQGFEGSCVGHAIAMERAISNTRQAKYLSFITRYYTRRYDPLHIWENAKARDEWTDTNPGDDNGTSVRAGYEVCRWMGCVPIKPRGGMQIGADGAPYVADPNPKPLSPEEGVSSYVWARSIDDIRTAIAHNIPVVIGINWYADFDRPTWNGTERWIGASSTWGSVRGGHALCIYGASDARQGFKIKNSWGKSYPLVYLGYSGMERLLAEDGEVALIVDR